MTHPTKPTGAMREARAIVEQVRVPEHMPHTVDALVDAIAHALAAAEKRGAERERRANLRALRDAPRDHWTASARWGLDGGIDALQRDARRRARARKGARR